MSDSGPSMGEYEEAYGIMDASEAVTTEDIEMLQSWTSAAAALVTWTSQNGRVTRIVDLADSHLKNIIRLLRREAPEKKAAQIAGLALAALYDGVAPDFAITELVRLNCISPEAWLREAEPRYEILLAEALKRGLET